MAKIAIIEDETAIAGMYKFKLEQLGHEVRLAINGVEGLKLSETYQPDLILLDLMMPEMDGEKMLEKVRATDWGKDIKVIILTNISNESQPPGLKNLNIAGYMVKANYTPVQVAEISDTILTGGKV
ncbi:MAG TPA: response regulator [Candidatus Saccharimonadales bacterium]|nr:response regulator [Candidatus Saccharimonadales bacterium]